MPEHILFYVVFLSQIFIISYYFPRKIYRQSRYILDTYPPATHPKLYTKPIECYEIARRNYQYVNVFILIVGLLILGAFLSNPHDGDVHNAIVMGYFPAQMFPVFLMDLSALKELKLMRIANPRTTRHAELRPRRLFDFVSPALFGIAVITYIAFVSLIFYVQQFGFEWFGGYWNVLGITVMNAFCAGFVYWHMVGKKLNPHETSEDRGTRIRTMARIIAFTSIAVTLFIAVSIALSAFDVRYLLPIFLSVYVQVLAVIGFQAYRIDNRNFDVYKENPLVT